MEEDKFKWEGNGAKAEEFKKLYKQAEAYDVGFEAGKQQARAEVIAEMRDVWIDLFGEDDLDAIDLLIRKLERGA